MSRRGFMARGAAGFLGLAACPEILYATPRRDATADHVIFIWLSGGPSHIDMFDPKTGPTGGEYKAISTAADGIQICEHMPGIAKQMDHCGIVRSLTSREGSHERGTYMWKTGYKPIGSIEHPTIGSIVAKERVRQNKELPAYIAINRSRLGNGYLPASYGPYRIADSNRPTRNLTYARGVSGSRFQKRINQLNYMNRPFQRAHHGEVLKSYAQYAKDAIVMMRAKTASAFDTSKESGETRARYGRNPFGQSCLLAKRLVDVGVRFVELETGGWDTHNGNFDRVKSNLGTVDPAVSALIQDLRDLNKLDRTMIVMMGEFGRTPKINATGGRDHWPRVWSAFFAGGGIKGGSVVGASSSDGGTVKDRPVLVGDLHATIFQAMGVDLTTRYTSPEGRPFDIVGGAGGGGGGEPIDELMA